MAESSGRVPIDTTVSAPVIMRGRPVPGAVADPAQTPTGRDDPTSWPN
jgi:hypothetical protein